MAGERRNEEAKKKRNGTTGMLLCTPCQRRAFCPYFTWLAVGFEIDIHLVTCADMGKHAVFCANREHEPPAH